MEAEGPLLAVMDSTIAIVIGCGIGGGGLTRPAAR